MEENRDALPEGAASPSPLTPVDEPTPEELERLRRDKKLSSENQKLRTSRNEAFRMLGCANLEEFNALKLRIAAGEPVPAPKEPNTPEPAQETEPASEDRRVAGLWKLVASSRPVDADALFEVLSAAVTDVRDGVCYDSTGEPIEASTVRAALPRFTLPVVAVGGSGGRTPAPLPSPPAKPDPIESALGSQRYYEKHKAEVLAAERGSH